jgi:hypothetical protein
MRLADFILFDMEGILKDWQTFAGAQLPAAASMNALALRDTLSKSWKRLRRTSCSPRHGLSKLRNPRDARLK